MKVRIAAQRKGKEKEQHRGTGKRKDSIDPVIKQQGRHANPTIHTETFYSSRNH